MLNSVVLPGLTSHHHERAVLHFGYFLIRTSNGSSSNLKPCDCSLYNISEANLPQNGTPNLCMAFGIDIGDFTRWMLIPYFCSRKSMCSLVAWYSSPVSMKTNSVFPRHPQRIIMSRTTSLSAPPDTNTTIYCVVR